MFSQSQITAVNPPVAHGSQILLSWISSAPAGTLFQVYVEGALMYGGVATSCAIPAPLATARIEVGTVAAGERMVNWSAFLPTPPPRRATLTWLGGTYLDDAVAGFHVYGEHSPGGGIDYSVPLATLPAYTGGVITDGYGCGGYGQGGFGAASGSYSWTSPPAAGGVWNYAVCAFDAAGNIGPPRTIAATLAAPPPPPAPFSDGSRLHSQYTPASREAVLTWNPSPA